MRLCCCCAVVLPVLVLLVLLLLLLSAEARLELQWCFHLRAVKAAGGRGCGAPCAMRSGRQRGVLLLPPPPAHPGSRRIQAPSPIGRVHQNNGHHVTCKEKEKKKKEERKKEGWGDGGSLRKKARAGGEGREFQGQHRAGERALLHCWGE